MVTVGTVSRHVFIIDDMKVKRSNCECDCCMCSWLSYLEDTVGCVRCAR